MFYGGCTTIIRLSETIVFLFRRPTGQQISLRRDRTSLKSTSRLCTAHNTLPYKLNLKRQESLVAMALTSSGTTWQGRVKCSPAASLVKRWTLPSNRFVGMVSVSQMNNPMNKTL